jgi:hypothetical protein
MRITNFILSLLAVTTFTLTVCARTHGHEANPHPAATPSASPRADNGKSNKDNKTDPAKAETKTVVIPPEKSKPVTVPKFDKAPVIDGRLDDDIWQKAAVLKDFYQIQPWRQPRAVKAYAGPDWL